MQSKSTPSEVHSSRRDGQRAARSLSQPAHRGRFTLEQLVGEGGACHVYRAQDGLYDRVVAVKTPAAETTQAGSKSNLRLRREGLCLARLDHPSIVRFHDGHFVERRAGKPFLVMEFVPGASLADWLERHGPVPPVVAMMIGLVVARALAEAHRAGVIHRDVKPANLLVDERHPGRLLLCDFGAAWLDDGLHLTAHDERVGTPAFMSPEQTRGGRVTAYTDLFSLGGTLHELVTGALPFPGETREEVMGAIQRCQYAAPEQGPQGLVPRYLGVLLEQCLRAQPAERPTAEAASEWLEEALALDELGDVERHLGRYFKDPEGYAAHLSLFVSARALLNAAVAYRGQLWDVAAERCRRALEAAPGHPKAQEMLRLAEARAEGRLLVTDEFALEESLGLGDLAEPPAWDDGETGVEAGAAAAPEEGASAAVRGDEAEARVGETRLMLPPEERKEARAPSLVPQRGRRRGRRRWVMGVAAVAAMVATAVVAGAVWRARSGEGLPGMVGQEPGSEVWRRIEALRTKDEVLEYAVAQLRAQPGVAFRQMMAVLDGEHESVQEDGIEDALYQMREISQELMLQQMAAHTRQPSAQVVARVLGQMAFRDLENGVEPDARIVPHLTAAISARLADGTAAIWGPMRALEAIARLRPLPGVDLLMGKVLDRALREEDQADALVVQRAASVLVMNGGELAASELRARADHRRRVNPLRRGIEEALLEHRERLARRH